MNDYDLPSPPPSPFSPGFGFSPVASPAPSERFLNSPDAAELMRLTAAYPAFARAYYRGVTSAEHALAAENVANKENILRGPDTCECGEVEKSVSAMFARVRCWCEVAADGLEREARGSIRALCEWREQAETVGADREVVRLLAQHAPPPRASPLGSRFFPAARAAVRGFLAWRASRIDGAPPLCLMAELVDSTRLRGACLAAGGDDGRTLGLMLTCAPVVHARLEAAFFGPDAGSYFEGERFLAPLLRALDAAPRDPGAAFLHRHETLALWLLPFGALCRDARAAARAYYAETVRSRLDDAGGIMAFGLASCSAQWAHYVARIFVQRSCWRHFDEFVRGGMLET